MLTFVQAVKICALKKPFNWKDRASRSEFWWFSLFCFLVEIVLGLLTVIPILGVIIGFLSFFVSIAFWWLSLMVSIRRLHDQNKSGFLLLLPTAGCLVFFIMSMLVVMTESEILSYIAYIILLLPFAAAIYLFVLFVTRGTVGYNRFGADPLELDYSDISNDFSFQEAKRMFGDARDNFGNRNNASQNQGAGFDPSQNQTQGFDVNNGFNPSQNQTQGFDVNNGFNPSQNQAQGFDVNNGFNPSQNSGQEFNLNHGFDPSQLGNNNQDHDKNLPK